MKDLILSLKTQWFIMWRSGDKKIDFREIKPYWAKRFCETYDSVCKFSFKNGLKPCVSYNKPCKYFKPKKYERLILNKGYPQKEDSTRRLIRYNPVVGIGKGDENLGSDPKQFYYTVSIE